MGEPIKKEYLSSFVLWGESLSLARKVIFQSLRLSLPWFFVPLFCFSVVFSYFSGSLGGYIDGLAQGEVEDIVGFLGSIVSYSSSFISFYLFSLALLFVLGIIVYFSFVQICISVHLDNESLSTKKCLNKVRPLIFKGIVIFLGLMLLSFEQVFFGPFRIFSLLGIMAVVLVFREKTGAVQSLWHGITLKYIGQIPGRGLSVFLVILMTTIIINFYEALVSSLVYYFLHLDEVLNISNALWVYTLPGFPCTLMYLLSRALVCFSMILLMLFVSCFSVCLYKRVRKPLSERL
jgi:hypothetical protein